MIDKKYYENKLNEIPKNFLDKCLEKIKIIFDNEENINTIKKLFEEKGEIEWAIPYHMFWGMHIRNALREAGLTDDNLPDGNWDDYYIQVVELGLGLRQL